MNTSFPQDRSTLSFPCWIPPQCLLVSTLQQFLHRGRLPLHTRQMSAKPVAPCIQASNADQGHYVHDTPACQFPILPVVQACITEHPCCNPCVSISHKSCAAAFSSVLYNSMLTHVCRTCMDPSVFASISHNSMLGDVCRTCLDRSGHVARQSALWSS
jgi:hypothetical protein